MVWIVPCAIQGTVSGQRVATLVRTVISSTSHPRKLPAKVVLSQQSPCRTPLMNGWEVILHARVKPARIVICHWLSGVMVSTIVRTDSVVFQIKTYFH